MSLFSSMTDGELVEALRAGNTDAFEELVQRYQAHVYAMAYSLVSNWADAQDITQEVFIRAHSKLEQLREPERFAAWLRPMTFGVAKNWLRAFRPQRYSQISGQTDGASEWDIPDVLPGPSEAAETREITQAVLSAIVSLRAKYRLPLLMFHLDGLGYEKVAAFLELPVGTVKSLINRAQQQLPAALSAVLKGKVEPMVEEALRAYRLPADFARIVNDLTGQWWNSLKPSQEAVETAAKEEAQLLDSLQAKLGEISEWAMAVRKSMPTWGFEACSHRWLEGLEECLGMIAQERHWESKIGHCGDVPATVGPEALRRVAAAQQWLDGLAPADEMARQVFDWLGSPTPAKQEAARCFVEITRTAFAEGGQAAAALGQEWRKRAEGSEILGRMFYGDGLDNGLRSACGFQTINRLDIFLRMIGGDDTRLEETRWFCNTQLRYLLRDDPRRATRTHAYLWGLYAFLSSRDEAWAAREHPRYQADIVHVLRTLGQGTPITPLRRWLVGSLLSTTKFWYQRTLNFIGREEAPVELLRVPVLDAATL